MTGRAQKKLGTFVGVGVYECEQLGEDLHKGTRSKYVFWGLVLGRPVFGF